jgi:uncharacterized protein
MKDCRPFFHKNELLLPTTTETLQMLGKIDVSFLNRRYLSSCEFFSGGDNIIRDRNEGLPSKLTVSKFTHTFSRGDIIALYHSLNLKTIYLSKHLFNVFFKLKGEMNILRPLLRQRIDLENQKNKQILRKLYEMGFLVTDDKEDEFLLASIQKKYLQPQLRKLYIIVTNKCNLSCWYCYLKRYAYNNDASMDTRTAVAGIDLFVALIRNYLSDNEKVTFCFYGGEPFLNFQVFKSAVEYIDVLRKKCSRLFDAQIEVVTNGTLLTKEIVLYLRKFRVGVNVSIDGESLKTNVHRVFKGGSNSVEIVLRSIDILNKYKIPTTLVSTISPQTLSYFNNIVGFLTSRSSSSCINILRPNTRLKTDKEFVLNSTKLWLDAYATFRKIGHYEERITKKVFHYINKIVFPFENGLSGQEIAIFPKGKVGVYHGYLDGRHTLGEVGNLSPQKVIGNQVYQEWTSRSPLNISECWGCPALGICGGGRPSEAEDFKGSIWKIDELQCCQSKSILNWLIWDNLQFCINT